MFNCNWAWFWLALVFLNGYFAHTNNSLLSLVGTIGATLAFGISLMVCKDD